ncbi:MAG: response regulator [gamma proteobacterium symbiont of Taylorina sp.]|nr:response regulator [gamma proteobacterium symbiont of Taylorina sp.]
MLNKPYILLADDDVSSQLTISKFLQEDFELQLINNYGRDCLISMLKRLPDLIILGSHIYLYGERNTHEFLRSKNEYQAIPIISICTEIPESENDRYVPDTLNKDSLLTAIKQLLDNKLEQK